jgi:hypothetical protein
MAYTVGLNHLNFDRKSSATEGFGINEGINWLSEIIKRKKK